MPSHPAQEKWEPFILLLPNGRSFFSTRLQALYQPCLNKEAQSRTTEQINQNSPQRARQRKPPVVNGANIQLSLAQAQLSADPIKPVRTTLSHHYQLSCQHGECQAKESIQRTCLFLPPFLLKLLTALKERGQEWGAELALFQIACEGSIAYHNRCTVHLQNRESVWS